MLHQSLNRTVFGENRNETGRRGRGWKIMIEEVLEHSLLRGKKKRITGDIEYK